MRNINSEHIPLRLLVINFIILLVIGFTIILFWQGNNFGAYILKIFSVTNLDQSLFIGFLGTIVVLSYILIASKLNLLTFPKTEYTEIILKFIKKPLGPFTIALGAGISEEVLFRGALLGLFSVLFGSIPGILISSIIFVLVHIPQYKGHLHSLVIIFIMGIFLGWLFLWKGSLWGPIFAHALYNYVNALFIKEGILKI